MIQQIDIKGGFSLVKEEIIEKITLLIESTSFIGGEEVSMFEKEFAQYNGTSTCVGCSNGTDAIIIALKALGIGNGVTVLVPVNSFIATSEAVSMVGAQVDFIDVEEEYFTIDPQRVEDYIKRNPSKRVGAVIAVHLYGQMADMKSLKELSDKYGFRLLEDAAQAHGAQFEGKGPGVWGDLATYSFYPGKNLGAFGDAGGITTNDKDLAKVCKMLTNHGRLPGEKYTHTIEGFNKRLDTLQAAVLRIKLRYLEDWNEARRKLAQVYNKKLTNSIIKPKVREGTLPVWYVYTIRVTDREDFIESTKNVFSSGIYYPYPLHHLQAYKSHASKSFPIAEKISQDIVSIPMYPELGNAIEKIIQTINDVS